MAAAKYQRNWQLIVAGILLAVFGVVCLVVPGITLASIAFMVGAGFLVSGVVNVITYVHNKNALQLSGCVLAYGIIDILIGLMFVIHPFVFAVVLPWLAGLFVVILAVYEIAGSFITRKGGFPLWGWLLLSGIISLIIGILFYVFPEMLALCIGFISLMRGISMIVLGANSRKFV